jgi:hypothetical protein
MSGRQLAFVLAQAARIALDRRRFATVAHIQRLPGSFAD